MKHTAITLGASAAVIFATLALATAPQAFAQNKSAKVQAADAEETDTTTADFEKFRAIMEEANPSELFEAKGEELWKTKRGPNNVSLAEKCDLGLGAGVTKGAYVKTPRYFKDVDQVMDIERRVVHCMVTQQGFKFADIAKKPFSKGDYTPDVVSIVSYVASQSKGMKISIPQKNPKEVEAYKIGKEIFNYRAGPYDFSCANCHALDGKRIRTQQLPNLSKPAGAVKAYLGWPAYRLTGGVQHTLQWRLNDCFRQQRFPEPGYVSDTLTALLTYLGANSNGHTYTGPGIKR